MKKVATRSLAIIENDLIEAVKEHTSSAMRIGLLLIEAEKFFGGKRPPVQGGTLAYREEFKEWAIGKTGLTWNTCMSYIQAANNPRQRFRNKEHDTQRDSAVRRVGRKAQLVFDPAHAKQMPAEDRRERRIAFVVDAAFYLDDDEWDEAHALIIQRRSERRRSQRVAA